MTDSEIRKDTRTDDGFQVGDWRVVPALSRITGPRGERHVAPRAMDLLVFLAKHAGQVMSKEAILDAVWHDVVVADAVVFRHISTLRRLLGDEASSPRFIETISKRGYRLIAAVSFEDQDPVEPEATRDEPNAAQTDDPRGRPRRRTILRRTIPWFAVAIALTVAVTWVLTRRDAEPSATITALSRDARAAELFLDGIATSRDPEPNQHAIELLRAAVELDPTFVSAWVALSERLYFHGSYGSGGNIAIEEAADAMRQAREIDPEAPGVLSRQVTLLTERGELAAAHDVARTLIRRHPGRAEAHSAVAYLYRYAGHLEAAARQCEAALSIAPNNYRLRSCAIVFYRLGRFDRASEILRLDSGSEWALHQQGLLDLYRGRPRAALNSWRKLSQEPWTTIPWAAMLENCLAAPGTSRTQINLRFSADAFLDTRDPEGVYFGALLMSVCGRPDLALELLEKAAERGYCALSAFDSEPAFSSLRDLAGFAAARQVASRCREAVTISESSP